jgi:hypothetical protein
MPVLTSEFGTELSKLHSVVGSGSMQINYTKAKWRQQTVRVDSFRATLSGTAEKRKIG